MASPATGRWNGPVESSGLFTKRFPCYRSNTNKSKPVNMRFLSIWFHHLATDWFALKQPALRTTPFVLAAPSHGRMVITAANALAESEGIYAGMVVADARAMFPSLLVLDDRPALTGQLLQRIAEWCIRFTPIAAVDAPAGLLLDVTGCTHLWGGDEPYLQDIIGRLKTRGYG